MLKFRHLYEIMVRFLLNKYNLTILEMDIVDSDEYIGSFNGETITIKNNLKYDHKLFLVAHLFGHCVQWCGETSSKYSNIEDMLPINNEGTSSKEQIDKLKHYEAEAAGYAVQLLHDALDINLAQWFSDWSRADWDHFINIKSLEDKLNLMEIKVKFGTKLISPLKINKIKLRKIKPKYAY